MNNSNLSNKEVIELDEKYLIQNFSRENLVLSHGRGTKLYDIEDNEYIDGFAGIAVDCLGHSHPRVTKAIQEQAEKLIHCSNFFYTGEQVKLAELLVKISPNDRVFFTNSGAESNEAAIKISRKFTGKENIISAYNSFHGRTLATVTATGSDKYKLPFKPLPGGFKHVPFGDIESIIDMIDNNTAAVMLECIQGEGGINIPPEGYLKEVEKVCHENDVLLILDEVQTGFARTGKMFASEFDDLHPDITSLAKGMGNGFPIGSILVNDDVSEGFKPGDHGTTFGGNPLACAASKATIDVLLKENLADRSANLGEYAKNLLEETLSKYDCVLEIRGRGLLIGIELSIPGDNIVAEAFKRNILLNCISGNVIRLAPALIIEKEEIDKIINVLDEILSQI